MTFSLIDELRKDLAATEERITHHTQYVEHYTSKRDQLTEAIRILEANELVKALTNHMRNLTSEEEKAHANVLNSIGEVVEENVFDEKPKRRVYTIRNNEPLVKMIIPVDEYDEYRRLWPDDAILVCVENGEILYAADNVLETDYHPSDVTEEASPALFADVLDIFERENALDSKRASVLNFQPQHMNMSQPPEWNYVGGASAITGKPFGRATKDEMDKMVDGLLRDYEIAHIAGIDVTDEKSLSEQIDSMKSAIEVAVTKEKE